MSTLTALLLPEFDHEMGTTRRLLTRIPEPDLTWRPHEKSMSMGELAVHLARLPNWMEMIVGSSGFDLATADFKARTPDSCAALVAEFDANAAAARASVAPKTDAELMAPWTLRNGDSEIFTLPRLSAVRSFVMNHTVHHRGQLSVYLRLRNVALPSIYGPTADEQ